MRIFQPLIATLFFAALLVSCNKSVKHTSDKEMDTFITNLMQKMTIEEKIGQLNLLAGYEDIITGQATSSEIGKNIKEGRVGALLNVKSLEKIRALQEVAVNESRLGIPLIFGMDVIHGYKTIFPIPLALASSFDMELIEQSARIAAIEASADGICWNFSPMVDITRDPRWGRIAEGGGEDPFLVSKIAEAFVRGYQGDDLADSHTILACVKHFALYGAAEGGRDYNTTDMSRIRMFNEYFPPFLAAIKAGAGSVMTSFNEVDGIPASGNKWLLTEVLRDKWGFNGFVVTDYTAINEMVNHGVGDLQTVSALALNAGVDMDMIGEGYISTLGKSLELQKITKSMIERSCRRILEAKYKLGLFKDPFLYCDPERIEKEIFTEKNNEIARDIAAQTFVLLKNQDHLLPLQKKGKIALIGPLADNQLNMAGMWSVSADHSQSVTVLKGFRDAVSDQAEIIYAKGCNIIDDPEYIRRIAAHGGLDADTLKTPEELLDEALKAARNSDVVVAVMGEAAEMSGESASRSDISLPGNHQQVLKALLKTGKPVVLVLFTGRPLTLAWEDENIPAILNVWFGGTQTGNAVADVIFGKVNPSGRLPVSFPRNVGQIPVYYNHKNTGRPLPEGEWYTKYLSNYLDIPNEPLYPFGYGLSYTEFEYSGLKLDKQILTEGDKLNVQVTLNNTGKYDGAEVVQLYIRDVVGSITRPVKELKGFKKVFLKAGESQVMSFTLTTEDLKFYNYDLKYDYEPGEFLIMTSGNSRDVLTASFLLQ
ncbi:MAG: beta-glucosidase BglX [Bacteroidales bacterium]